MGFDERSVLVLSSLNSGGDSAKSVVCEEHSGSDVADDEGCGDERHEWSHCYCLSLCAKVGSNVLKSIVPRMKREAQANKTNLNV